MSTPWSKRLSEAGHGLLQGLLQLVCPGHCLLCGLPLPSDQPHFCTGCAAGVLTDRFPSCPCCASTVGPYATYDGKCGNCRKEALHFDQALRLGPYDGPLRDAIMRLKRPSGEGLAELLGECFAERDEAKFSTLRVEAVVPVPLHWARRMWRGYNQSRAVAHGLASRLRLPCRRWWLRRARYGRSQVGLSGAERRENVRGAFCCWSGVKLAGQNVLLVDDVMTTGATASEAARALKDAGAGSVIVAALGRA